MNSVAVVGAGAWGTALAIQAHRAGCRVTVWARTPFLGRVSPHLPGCPLPEGVVVTGSLPGAGFDAVVVAVPVQHLRGVLARLRVQAPVLLCAKGVEAVTLRLPLEILSELHPGAAGAVLSGPNFAHEVAGGMPAASVIAAGDAGLRGQLIGLLGSAGFRLYGNDDVIGAQLGGRRRT